MAKRKGKLPHIVVEPDGSWSLDLGFDWRARLKQQERQRKEEARAKRRAMRAPKDPPPPPEDPDQLRLFDEEGGAT